MAGFLEILFVGFGIAFLVQLVRRRWKSVGTLAVVEVLLLVAVGFTQSNSPAQTTSSAGSSSVAADPQPTESPSSVRAGTDAEVDGLKYRVTEAHLASTYGADYSVQKAAGEFVVVSVTVNNSGDKPADISNSDFHLVRGEKTFDSTNTITSDDGFFLTKLNPGTSRSGKVVFDVPKTSYADDYQLQVFGNGSSEHRTMDL